MILLSIRDISRQFDAEPVFRNVTFDVRPGERIGLVGPNGAGKTTLLHILAGRDESDTGEVERASAATIELLEQEARAASGRTLVEEARAGLQHLYGLQDEAHALAEQIAAESETNSAVESSSRLHRRFDELQHELTRHSAYNIEHRVDEVLAGLGFAREDYDRPLSTFSGGQQNRAALARMLLRDPEILLLDEPTNHLDIAATEWLEAWLASSTQAMLLVSHDRYFLDRVTNRILELHGGVVSGYKGNFTAYWRQRDERRKVLARTLQKQQDFIAKTEDFIRRNKYGQKHAQAADREKKLERLERVDVPPEIERLPMTFGQPTRTGDWVIEATGVSKGFGAPLFRDFTLRIDRGDRLAIFGPNGSGKTTLLRVLIGELQPDAGTVRFGTGVRLAYFDQQLAGVDPALDAVEAVRPAGRPDLTPGTLRSLLARFGIRGEQAFQPVGSMSGGEKSKVALAKLAALEANVLVLDEPTNHLDVWARDSLEEALTGFEGTLVFVSHDRYFLDRVARSVVVLEPDCWRHYAGNYSDYISFLKNRSAGSGGTRSSRDGTAAADESNRGSGEARHDSRRKESRRKRRFPYRLVEDLEADIAAHEARVEELQAALADSALHRDGDRVRETLKSFEDARSKLAELYEHWEEAVELN
ncbi:MAG TPA: ABC-F family ATP-binding cassette domain-containing protein [Planctomycetaceae bacterium]|nr:ABC-F family ATP-binding cassette domain-containing protein [Planctomycetaceae bacterium]